MDVSISEKIEKMQEKKHRLWNASDSGKIELVKSSWNDTTKTP